MELTGMAEGGGQTGEVGFIAHPPSAISHPLVNPSDWLSANTAAATDELFDFLRIESISARSEHKKDVARAADWLA